MSRSTGSVEELGQTGGAACPIADSAELNRGGRGLGLLGTFTLAALVSAAISVGALYVYDQRCAQKVVAFDLPGYVEAVQEEVGRGTMTEEQMAASLSQVERLLSGVSANHVVLSREVVLRNARELALPMTALEASHSSSHPLFSPKPASPDGPAPGPVGNKR